MISEYLHNRFPDHAEGELTKIRATVVSDTVLADVAKKMRIGEFLLLSRNEHRSGGATRKSNIANALEALFAAIYLDRDRQGPRYHLGLLNTISTGSASKDILTIGNPRSRNAQKTMGLLHYHVVKRSGQT